MPASRPPTTGPSACNRLTRRAFARPVAASRQRAHLGVADAGQVGEVKRRRGVPAVIAERSQGEPLRLGAPLPVVDDPSSPRFAHSRGPVRVGEQVADRRRDRADVPAVDHHTRLTVADGLGCSAGPARDDRHARRGGLQIDDAEALDVQARAAGAARHREHVGHRVVCRQFVAGHAVGEHHVLAHAEAVRQPVQGRSVRAAADDDEGGAGHPLPDRGHRPDQHVLALARHQPRHTHHHRPVAPAGTGRAARRGPPRRARTGRCPRRAAGAQARRPSRTPRRTGRACSG